MQQVSARASYISTTSTDEFLKYLSNRLENGFLDRLTVASEFSLMVDETMDIADQAKFAIFACYDSDKHSVTEEFLGLTDIVMYWRCWSIMWENMWSTYRERGRY